MLPRILPGTNSCLPSLQVGMTGNAILQRKRSTIFTLLYQPAVGQNKDAYDKGVATLVPAVDDEFSKIWLLQ